MKDGRAELKEEGCTGRDLCEQCCGQICLLVEKQQEGFYEPPEHLFRDQPADEQGARQGVRHS